MNATLKKWSDKFDGLQRRERVLIFGAVLFGLMMVLNALLIDPPYARIKQLHGEIATDTTQIQTLNSQIQLLIQNGPVDPDAANKARLAALQSEILTIDTSLDGLRQGFVTPEKMPQLLESLLKKNGQLKLLSLRTLPVAPLFDTEKTAENAAKPAAELPVYRHGVEIIVEGRYADLLQYLVALEQLSWNMLWSKVSLSAGAPGTSSLTLTVYTLSLDKAWLTL